MADSKKSVALAKLTALQALFHEQLPENITAIVRLCDSCCNDPAAPEENIHEFKRLCHNLAGLSGTFGVDAVGEAALNIDLALTPIIDAGQSMDESQQKNIGELVAALELESSQWQPSMVDWIPQDE